MTYKLSITSWVMRSRGTGGAEHYYGRVRFDGNEVDLEHEVSLLDPLYADSSLKRMFAKPGETETTVRFAFKDDLLKVFREFLWGEAKPTDNVEIRLDGNEVKS